MRLVVTGGGTGGHIYPALAVAEALQADPIVEAVQYLGKTGGLESELVPQNGIPFQGISFYGMPRGKTPLLPFQLAKWGLVLLRAKAHARRLLLDFRPDVVFGTGGYVSAPVLMAARSLKIPYVVHEPDAQPGLVNRLMSRNAAVITTSFSEGAERLRHRPEQRILISGNPIRGSIGGVDKITAYQQLGWQWPIDRPVLLVTGGSQGARRLNRAIVEALPALLDELGFAVAHLTGKKLFDETMTALAQQHPALQNHPHYWVRPYSGEMGALLATASVAVCRAGSLSLSEMYLSGIPTVLVPYPFAAADHQRKNAEASVRAGASCMLDDADCTGERLLSVLRPLMQDAGRLQTMQSAALALGFPNATQTIADCLKQFAR